MSPHVLRFSFGALLVLAVLSEAAGQADKGAPGKGAPPAAAPPEKAGTGTNDYRQFFRTPETASDFWNAIQFEMEVGRYDLAARHLRGLVQKATDQELAQLAEKVGTVAFLQLRNVQKWSDDPKVNAQAKKDVDALVGRVTAAVQKQLGDAGRIQAFIKNLNASPEEHAYALKELYRSGDLAIPYLIDALREASPEDRLNLLAALRQLLDGRTLPPVIAALDSNDPQLQVDLLDVILKGAARSANLLGLARREVVPHLWYLSASTRQPPAVRRKATEALALFLDTPASKLPPAKLELTKQAERYYKHEVKFPNPGAVTVWRWDGSHVVAGWPGARTISASRAEEYYGLRYARQALALDPTYQPAQLILLSLVLDKGEERAGLGRPLERAAPAVHDLLATVSPDLVVAVLERALDEHRVPVILGAVRDLGARAEVQAARPSKGTEPPLVRALYYPDRRVQMAAAEALLQIPGSAAIPATTRVVDVLRRAVAANPDPKAKPKVLVGYFNNDTLDRVSETVRRAGFEPVPVRTGRDVLLRLNQAADIDLLLLDADLPDPGLASLLGQLRVDSNAGVPVVLTAPADRLEPIRRFAERTPNVTVVPFNVATDTGAVRGTILARVADPGAPALSDAERKDYAERAIRALAGLAQGNPPGYDVRPAADAVYEAIRAARLSPEGQIAAVQVAGRLPGTRPQVELANAVLDARRPAAVRVAAAEQLIRQIQKQGPLLARAQVEHLAALFGEPRTDPGLKAQLALVLGSLRPGVRQTGERLRSYQPPEPAPLPKAKE
jgi:CheY-like chemotaxis protein